MPADLDGNTPVFDLVEDDDSPVTAGQFRDAFERISSAISKIHRKNDTGEQERSAQLEQILARAPDPVVLGVLQSDVLALKQGIARLEAVSDNSAVGVRDHASSLRMIGIAAGIAVTFALGSVLAVMFRMLDTAKLDGEATIKIDHVERGIDAESKRLDRIEQLLLRQPSLKDAP